MSGIIITPGTFAAAPSPSPLRQPSYPAAKTGYRPRRPQQWNSLPQILLDGSGGDPDAYDASPAFISPFTIGYRQFFGSTIFDINGTRYLPFDLEWRGIPANRSINVGFGNVARSGDGSEELAGQMALQFRMLSSTGNPAFVGSTIAAIADAVSNGRTWVANDSGFLHPGPVPFDYGFITALQVTIRNTAANTTLRSWTIRPGFPVTFTTQGGAATIATLPSLQRALRVTYSDDAYQLQVPSNWTIL